MALFRCTHCHRLLHIADRFCGRRVRCEACRTVQPAPPEDIEELQPLPELNPDDASAA